MELSLWSEKGFLDVAFFKKKKKKTNERRHDIGKQSNLLTVIFRLLVSHAILEREVLDALAVRSAKGYLRMVIFCFFFFEQSKRCSQTSWIWSGSDAASKDCCEKGLARIVHFAHEIHCIHVE